MEYTLWEFLRSDIAADVKQLTCTSDYRQVCIESVTVQELSSIDGFIQPNELVISTAEGCLDNLTAFRALIRAVRESGAAALILSFKDPHYTVPQEVISYAAAEGLPMFSIPWEVRFSDVQTAVHEAVQSKKLSLYQTLQTELFNAYFESKPLEDAAAQIRSALQVPTLITNTGHQPLAQSGAVPAGLNNTSDMQELEISISGIPAGYLQLYPADSGKTVPAGPKPQDHLLQKYVCFPLSLWFNRKNIEDLTTLRLKNDFVWDLAHTSGPAQIELLKQGARLHFDLSHPYTCALLRAVPHGQNQLLAEYSDAVTAVSVRMEDLLIQAAKASRTVVMVSSRSLDFILYLANPQTAPEKAAEHLLDQLHQQLASTFPAYDFYWGISEVSLKAPDFPQLYQNAELALQYCLHSGGTQYRFTYQDTKETQIVSALSGNEKIRQIAEELLRPLQRHSGDSSTDLMETLAAFIRCNYNTSQTARALHIHRQSLLYRLDKIRDLTGMTLEDHQELFLLEVSLRVFSLYS